MKGILQFLLVIIIKARNVHWQDFRWCVAGARWHWPKVYISLVWLLAKQRSFRTFMATTNAEMQQKSGNKITRDKISTYFRYKTAVMAASIGTGTCTPTWPIRENGKWKQKQKRTKRIVQCPGPPERVLLQTLFDKSGSRLLRMLALICKMWTEHGIHKEQPISEWKCECSE